MRFGSDKTLTMKNEFTIEPWNSALQAFLKTFPIPLSRVIIAKDGKCLTFKLRGSKFINEYMELSRLAILMGNLPLTVKRDTFQSGNVIFSDNIEIHYTTEKEELLCY
jgi:hypothetical protein